MRSLLLPCALVGAAVACSDTVGPDPLLDLPVERTSLTVGQSHSCAIAVDGSTYCWGVRPGPDPGVDLAPVAVGETNAFLALSAGAYYTCGMTGGGSVHCWGSNRAGSLGTGDTISRAVPEPVVGSHRFAMLSGGAGHTCGIATHGEIHCWGSNWLNQLGVDTPELCDVGGRDGPLSCSTTPVSPAPSVRFTALAAGANYTCATSREGGAYCWGLNWYGQLGNGSSHSADVAHVRVTGTAAFASLSAGGDHTCGLTSAGRAYCWGLNNTGQLGGSTAETCSFSSPCSTAPVAVDDDHTFRSLALGSWHTCGLTPAGEAYCWGRNAEGELGTGAASGNHATPARVAGNHTFARLSAGQDHTCGITTDGRAYCWGVNTYGQLGDGTTNSSNVPVAVAGNLTFRAE